MFVLHVDLQLKAGEAKALQKTYRETFRPAISSQEGFVGVHLLCAHSDGEYRLVIAFQNQPQQQKWVATDLHQQVWPLMEAHCTGYSVKTFDAV